MKNKPEIGGIVLYGQLPCEVRGICSVEEVKKRLCMCVCVCVCYVCVVCASLLLTRPKRKNLLLLVQRRRADIG